jgi:hypothetical protein
MYDDGSVAYDRPEIVPAYLKTAVAKALRDHINAVKEGPHGFFNR